MATEAPQRITRAERLAQIRPLLDEGLTYREIGERLGITASGVGEIVCDPDASKARARKALASGAPIDRELCRPVRLADVPANVRLQAARTLAETDPNAAPALLAAAVDPDPEFVAWVAAPSIARRRF